MFNRTIQIGRLKMKNIQVFKPFYRKQEILSLIEECLDAGWTGIGGKMTDFEKEWVVYSGAKTCHMLNSATSGLHLAAIQLKMKVQMLFVIACQATAQ